MPLPRRVTRARSNLARAIVCTCVAVTLAVVTTAVAGPAAHAEPAGGLCKMNTSRGIVPDTFAIAACVDGASIWLRNTLEVPVRIAVTGDTGTPVKVLTDARLAAMVTRLTHPDLLLMMPGDILSIPVGAGAASASVAGTDAGLFYVEAETLATFIPGGKTVDKVLAVYEAFTDVVKGLADATAEYADCMAGQNWVQNLSCVTTLTRKVTLAFGLDSAKVWLAFIEASPALAIALVLNTASLLKLLGAQVPSVEKILGSDRTINVAAKPVSLQPATPGCPGKSTFGQTPGFIGYRITDGPKCVGEWAAAGGIRDFPAPPGPNRKMWIILRYSNGSWRIWGGSEGDLATGRPPPPLCNPGPPPEIIAFLACTAAYT